MWIKEGVLFNDLSPQMLLGAVIVLQVFNDHSEDCTITSGTDGRHSENSLHYVGKAMDFRTRNMDAAKQRTLTTELRRRLGDNFDVVLERDHLHVEYDPG